MHKLDRQPGWTKSGKDADSTGESVEKPTTLALALPIQSQSILPAVTGRHSVVLTAEKTRSGPNPGRPSGPND